MGLNKNIYNHLPLFLKTMDLKKWKMHLPCDSGNGEPFRAVRDKTFDTYLPQNECIHQTSEMAHLNPQTGTQVSARQQFHELVGDHV